MTEKYNIFIEGIPGSGKTTLLNTLSNQFSNYNVYREGDISPVELAWCAFMNKEQYNKMLVDMLDLKNEIENNTVKEGNHFIISYTKILTENYQFYEYMEKYEVYGGRRNSLEFKNIILQKFRHFQTYGNLFECSFFQNIIEELMLFAMYNDKQIVEFFKEIISLLDISKFKLIRLLPTNIEDSIKSIKCERVNEKGEQDWYQLMMNYLSNSPYGKTHNILFFEDMITHFKRRIELENEVMKLLPKECCLNVESKRYDIIDIISNLTNLIII